MADVIFITCPDCDSKFKSTSDKEGKKVRCPECDEPFRVEEDMITRPKPPKKPAKKDAATETAITRAPGSAKPDTAITKRPDAPKPPPPKPTPQEAKDLDEEFDNDGNPYTVVNVDVKPRCPNCAKEMADEKAFICLYCGYNSLTREIGKFEKTLALSFEEHMLHLALPLTSITVAIIFVISLLTFSICFPDWVRGSWLDLFDSEAVRMWLTIFAMAFIYGFGSSGLNKVIFHPKPKEREKE